jgi:hypothetical protein
MPLSRLTKFSISNISLTVLLVSIGFFGINANDSRASTLLGVLTIGVRFFFLANIKYAYKYNTVSGLWEGTIEPTGSTNVKVTSGSSIFRSNSELTRRQVLSTITGAGSTGKTLNDGGIEYNVKSVGIVDYYFKHWYTDL